MKGGPLSPVTATNLAKTYRVGDREFGEKQNVRRLELMARFYF